MLYWLAILVFGVPLYMAVKQMRATKVARKKQLEEIQRRIKEKQEEETLEKIERIKQKH